MFKRILAQIKPALVITRREFKDQTRDWRIVFPIILLTLFFPGLMNFTARRIVGFVEGYGAPIIGERLIPFLLMVVGFFPISISLVIALESFVGEKERRSIEPLLSSPLTDGQLYLGKLLAAVIPPLFASFLGIGVYLIGVYRQVGWQPDLILITQILLLTSVQALVMVSGAVVISSQTTSVRAANLMASFIIIPVALLLQGESVVMFWGNYSVLWWVILGLLVIAGLLIRTGVAHFSREELLGQELDMLNLHWGWRVFVSEFRGGVGSIFEWYRQTIRRLSGKMGLPLILTILALITAAWIGGSQAKVFILPPGTLDWGEVNHNFLAGNEVITFFSLDGVGLVWLHNLRAVLLALILGMFSFGVLGVIVMMLPLVLVGYFTASLAATGVSPGLFLGAFILPHGILEIPAIILTGSAILHLGATLAAPAHGQTVGESFLRSLANMLRVILGLVLPLLLGAAFLEVFVTPRVIAWSFGG